MSERRQFILRNEAIKQFALQQLSAIQPDEAHPPVIEQREMTRSLDQNAKMWAVLDDISKQVDWYGRKLSSEDWKHVLTASKKKQEAVPGMGGLAASYYLTPWVMNSIGAGQNERAYAFLIGTFGMTITTAIWRLVAQSDWFGLVRDALYAKLGIVKKEGES